MLFFCVTHGNKWNLVAVLCENVLVPSCPYRETGQSMHCEKIQGNWRRRDGTVRGDGQTGETDKINGKCATKENEIKNARRKAKGQQQQQQHFIHQTCGPPLPVFYTLSAIPIQIPHSPSLPSPFSPCISPLFPIQRVSPATRRNMQLATVEGFSVVFFFLFFVFLHFLLYFCIFVYLLLSWSRPGSPEINPSGHLGGAWLGYTLFCVCDTFEKFRKK